MSSRSSSDVSALILAGGKATRFGGIAKHELVIDGETIFARQVRVLAPRVAEILVSGPTIEGYRSVRDSVEGVGPLAGIAAGLAACRTSWLLIVAGDMPYITGELIDRLVGATRVAPRVAADGSRLGPLGSEPAAVGIRIDGLPEPLVCALRREVLPIVERRIASGRNKASGLLTDEGLRVHWIDDADRRALRNVNSPEDL